jgi:hypothetical protein
VPRLLPWRPFSLCRSVSLIGQWLRWPDRWQYLSVVAPMLVSPALVLPAGEEWAFEVKWDGMRTLVSVGPAVRVHSRNGHDHTAAFPELAALGPFASLSRPDNGLAQLRASDVGDSVDAVCADHPTGRSHLHSFRRDLRGPSHSTPCTVV